MGKLIWHESCKLFSSKPLGVIILIMVLSNCLITHHQIYTVNSNLYSSADIANVYKELENMNSDEEKSVYLYDKIITLSYLSSNQTYDESSIKQISAMQAVLEEIQKVSAYPDFLQNIDDQTEEMSESFFFASPNSFSYRNLQNTPAAYKHLKNVTLKADISDGVRLITDTYITDIFLLIGIIAIVLSLTVAEREDGTLSIIKPTKYGYFHTISAKAITIFIFSAVLVFIFYGGSYYVILKTIGFGDLNRALQSVNGYFSSPLFLTVKQCIVLFFIAKFIGVFAFISIFFLLCLLCKNTIYSCLVGVLLFTAELLAYMNIDTDSYLSFFKEFNFVALCATSHYFNNYVNLNIFNHPVNTVSIGIITSVFYISLGLLLGIYIYVKETSVQSRSNQIIRIFQQRKKTSKYPNVHLFSHEAYKILIGEKAMFILIVLLLVQFISIDNMNYFINREEYYYQSYCAYLSGEITIEKTDYIQSEKSKIDSSQLKIDELNKKYKNNEISLGTLEMKLYSLNIDENQKNAFNRAYDQYKHVEKLVDSGISAEFIYQTPWEHLIANEAIYYDRDSFILLFITLILALSSSASVEKKTNMNRIITASPKGAKAVDKRKIIINVIYAFLATVVSFLPRIVMIIKIYGLPAPSSPVQSVISLSSFPISISVINFFIILQVLHLLMSVSASIVVYYISKLTGNKIITIIINSLLFVIPLTIYFNTNR